MLLKCTLQRGVYVFTESRDRYVFRRDLCVFEREDFLKLLINKHALLLNVLELNFRKTSFSHNFE